jgi:GxxExxY protein
MTPILGVRMNEVAIQRERNGKHDDLTRTIIGISYDVYNELGLGFVQSVYKECMRMALAQEGLSVATEVPIPVHFRHRLVGVFKADLIVNNSVLIELKVTEALCREHESQTLNYLRATNLEVALLMNFGLTAKFKRLIMDNLSNNQKSVSSVKIGVKPSSDGATIS